MLRLIGLTYLGLMIAWGAGVRDAFAVTISGTFNFSDTRTPNPFGFGTTPRITFGATSITPSGAPTVVIGTQGATMITLDRDADVGSPLTFAPDDYFGRTFNLSLTGSWTLTATRGPDTATAVTNLIPNLQLLPFVQNLQILGTGLTPTLTWMLPDLTGFDVDRIRVRALDVTTPGITETFFQVDLPPTATSFTIPPGVLQLGHSFGFAVFLDDTESQIGFGTFLENRSRTFTQSAYRPVPEPSALLLLGSGLAALGGVAWSRHRRREACA